jgi:hypothetical protein
MNKPLKHPKHANFSLKFTHQQNNKAMSNPPQKSNTIFFAEVMPKRFHLSIILFILFSFKDVITFFDPVNLKSPTEMYQAFPNENKIFNNFLMAKI